MRDRREDRLIAHDGAVRFLRSGHQGRCRDRQAQHGQRCQGCDRAFDDPRYLELDHNRPRSDGGWNHITNRVLLCGPCNRAKSNTYTLSGHRRLNRTNGWMAQ